MGGCFPPYSRERDSDDNPLWPPTEKNSRESLLGNTRACEGREGGREGGRGGGGSRTKTEPCGRRVNLQSVPDNIAFQILEKELRRAITGVAAGADSVRTSPGLSTPRPGSRWRRTSQQPRACSARKRSPRPAPPQLRPLQSRRPSLFMQGGSSQPGRGGDKIQRRAREIDSRAASW